MHDMAGNNNAQKWTSEKVLAHLQRIEESALIPDTVYLVNALIKEGLYKEIWSYWKKIFRTDGAIQEKMLLIESIFEARLFIGGLKKELASSITIFGLKNNHKWRDQYSKGMGRTDFLDQL